MISKLQKYITTPLFLLGLFIGMSQASDQETPILELSFSKDEVNFIVIGDWGDYGKSQQVAVAKAMNAWAGQNQVDFITTTGDNIYDKGVTDILDPLWQQAFENIYQLPNIKDLNWYITLGNHDYQGNFQAQIDYQATNQNWKLPSTYYGLNVTFEGGQIALGMLDTNAFMTHYRNNPQIYPGVSEQDEKAQLSWFKSYLTQPADWRFAFGHHPVYGAGRYGDSNMMIDTFTPLFEGLGVDAYFAGHQHNMQRHYDKSVNYLISGGGGKLRPVVSANDKLKFAAASPGFMYVKVSRSSTQILTINAAGEIIDKAVVNASQKSNAIKPSSCANCTVKLEDNKLLIENKYFSRVFDWNEGHLISRSITDKQTNNTMPLSGSTPDVYIPGKIVKAKKDALQFIWRENDTIVPGHLEITIKSQVDNTQLKRVCKLFPNVPSLPCQTSIKGKLSEQVRTLLIEQSARKKDREMVEDPHKISAQSLTLQIDQLNLPGHHWQLTSSAFTVATDYNDTLLTENSYLLFRKPKELSGNILTIENLQTKQRLFVVKSSPAQHDQLFYPGFDYRAKYDEITVHGAGINAETISEESWTKIYTTAIGVGGTSDKEVLLALRKHQMSTRIFEPKRDSMVLMNTWGDRSRDDRVNERFILKELELAKTLGITHYQIDDGWQAGLSQNSASIDGNTWQYWKGDDWKPHPERFPNGLDKVIKKAAKLQISVGLWFNPSRANDYKTWERDADILIDLNQKYGITTFKIDGTNVSTKLSEVNLNNFFSKVLQYTNNQVVFNMDVTADQRGGFFYTNQFGNVYLENRYTDWGNYYPYRTLRNLWMVSKYVPPQHLQIEFLNPWRNPEKYLEGDAYAPINVPFDYSFAISLMAQPLAWFEASGLPPEGLKIHSTINKYKEYKADIQSQPILPIGEEPSGRSWTGFQAVGKTSGYLLLFREKNELSSSNVKTWLPVSTSILLTPLMSNDASIKLNISEKRSTDENGRLAVSLKAPHNFVLYKYDIEK